MRLSITMARWSCALVLIGSGAEIAFAVEASGLANRFGLVGVISDDSSTSKNKTPGVAVLRDKTNGVTMTLKTGESFPYEQSLKVVGVKRNYVTITDGNNLVQVTYGGSVTEEPAAEKEDAAESVADLDASLYLPGVLPAVTDSRSEDKPKFVSPGWVESNASRLMSEYLPLEEVDEEYIDFE